MLPITKTLFIVILGGLVSQPMKADTRKFLQDVFSTAVAKTTKSFTSMTATLNKDWAATVNISSWNATCLDSANNFSALSVCLHKHSSTCISLKDLTRLFNINIHQSLSSQDVASVSPALIYSLLSCDDKQLLDLAALKNNTQDTKPLSAASWGYSMLFVTLINLCSLMGALVLPCMKMKIYKLVLMFMVALAVGTLAGSGLFFLIPEAFMLTHDDNLDYVWKSATIMGGIYLFYITEKIMRMINAKRENTNVKKRKNELAMRGVITTSFRHIPIDNSIQGKDPAQIAESIGTICHTSTNQSYSLHSNSNNEIVTPSTLKAEDGGVDNLNFSTIDSGFGDSHMSSSSVKPASNGRSYKLEQHNPHQPSEIAPVAYMIIFGDALHNFIDGLSIGSAFTQSILTGVSVSVAVMCEELPHELGDFAILLNSGMNFKKALMYNFLSACTCYLGTIAGILLGENTESHEWIFAVAGGMFLYISLVDMMPEMNTAAETEEGKQFGEKKTFILQNCGLLTGFAVMLVFALYGRNIHFDNE